MKTLTELSGSVIRAAAAAIAEARRSLPNDEKPAAAATPEAPPAQSAEAATGEAPTQAAASVEAPTATDAAPVATDAAPAATDAPPVSTDAPPAETAPAANDAPPAAPSAQPAPKPPREAESAAAKEAIDAAVAKATGLSGDRLTMVQGAVEAAGKRTADVRLVRVFGLEEEVTGATKVGAYQFVVDLFPASMKQVTAPKDDRGRRGAGRGGGRGGGKGGGDRGVKGGGVGGFSMDSLREDRKNERGGRGGFGRPGGGRRPGGGGGRGGPGGPPGGAPKT